MALVYSSINNIRSFRKCFLKFFLVTIFKSQVRALHRRYQKASLEVQKDHLLITLKRERGKSILNQKRYRQFLKLSQFRYKVWGLVPKLLFTMSSESRQAVLASNFKTIEDGLYGFLKIFIQMIINTTRALILWKLIRLENL